MCGDGLVHGIEQCDDANRTSGDGCDTDCTYTTVWLEAFYHGTCALIEGGRLRCWGFNENGRLGYGHTFNVGDNELPYEEGDVPIGPVDQIQAGEEHTCAIQGDSVLCWGVGTSGQLGLGFGASIGDDEFASMAQPVDLGNGAVDFDVGRHFSCTIILDGSVRCWGVGFYGQLGNGSNATIGDDELPTAIGPIDLPAVATDIGTGGYHTCTILTTGSVLCWGRNSYGQLGQGHVENIGDDELPSVLSPLDFGVDATQIAMGTDHACVLLANGEVRCWGRGALGQASGEDLGDDEEATSVPAINLGGNAQQIASGYQHACALMSAGDLYCWGYNAFGAIGQGNTDNISEPALVDLAEIEVIQVAAGGFHTCVVSSDHQVYCWGWNNYGQLGLGMTDDVGDDELPTTRGPVPLFEPLE